MKKWRNIPGTELVWHGEWADPEIIYKGKSVNYWSVEDALELSYKSEDNNVGLYEQWVSEQDPKYLISILEEIIASQGDNR